MMPAEILIVCQHPHVFSLSYSEAHLVAANDGSVRFCIAGPTS